jgi:putative transcriptional regulator
MLNKVKQHRQWEGYTQDQLAKRIGVSRQTILAIEAGKYVPSTALALKLASVLKQPVEILFALEEGDWQQPS